MKEIVESHNQKYGSLREISKSDYPVEVTKASKEVDVVVLLYQDGVEESRVMTGYLEHLAGMYRGVKFLKIRVRKRARRASYEMRIVNELIPVQIPLGFVEGNFISNHPINTKITSSINK